jgi:hypothetical protein
VNDPLRPLSARISTELIEVYTFNFDPAKVGKLVIDALKLFSQVQQELLAFTEFLEEQT